MLPTLQRVYDSILAADVGSVWTRVLLIDRVDSQYRFVAIGDVPSTAEHPHSNVLVGVRTAIQKIEVNTGRRFLDDDGQLITPESAEGTGIDLLIVTSSAAEPLKVAVGGLVERVSLASAHRAACHTYSTITHQFALDSSAGRWGHPRGTLGIIEQLSRDWPDVIMLAGGTEGGAEKNLLELAQAITMTLQASPERLPPAVIFAGNSTLQEQIESLLGYTNTLIVSENLRPRLRTERLQLAGRFMEQQFRERCLGHLPGGEALGEWSAADLTPTLTAFGRVVQYLALRDEKRVLGVDIGGSSASLVSTFEDRYTQTHMRTDLGMADDAEKILSLVGSERLAAWVPGITPPDELMNEYLNLALQPSQFPMTRDTLRLLQGVAREILTLLLADIQESWTPYTLYPSLTPPFDIILGSGSAIREAPRPSQALAILLDSIQPIGITHIMRDRLGLAATIGALANAAPYAAADLIEAQGFESLATVISPIGQAQPGDPVLTFRLTQGEQITEGTAEYGQSYRFPTQQETQLELLPSKQFDIGLGPGIGTTLTRQGDAVGFVIDARGRPLTLPNDLSARRERIEEWLQYVGA